MAPTSRRPTKKARPAPRAARKPASPQPAEEASDRRSATARKPARARPVAPAVGTTHERRKQARPRAEPDASLAAPRASIETEPEVPRHPGRILPIEVDPRQVEEALAKLGGELRHWANKGRYTRVRFKFRGRQLLPDLPLAAVVAAEGLTFYWAGILRVLLVNVMGGSLLSVELVNDSEKRVQAGREALLSGDLDAALAHFRTALEMERDSASAHLNRGVALKLKGDHAGAREALEKARALDPEGGVGAEAERLLGTLPTPTDDTHFVLRTDVRKE